MSGLRLGDTIAAISTPVGEGGIGIVRLSGRDALRIADRIFVSKNGKKPSNFKTYTVHYGHIVERRPRTKSEIWYGAGPEPLARVRGRQKIVDEVILTVMRAPKSYTKEDIVEINCHSGIVPLRKILNMVLRNGARLAESGEFTKRAFLNGRIDIAQAESVLDIIKAKTDLSLRAALNNLEGLFSKKIKDIRNRLMDVFARIEASINFPEEEDVDKIRRKEIFKRLRQLTRDMEKLISTADQGRILRQGVKTVICGSPNVGKSSLLNALVKESRAIVTHIPGTTRDTIEEIVNIRGIPVVFIDTAGITDTSHPVEKEGIKRSRASIQEADLVLFVFDYSRKLNRNDRDIMYNLKDKDNLIIVVNKKDLEKGIDMSNVRSVLPKRPIAYVSAIDLSGIDKLEDTIQDLIYKGKAPTADFASVSNERQLAILQRSLEDIKEAVNYKAPVDCIGVYVRSSIENLGEITGHTITEEALDKIFSEFCIGK